MEDEVAKGGDKTINTSFLLREGADYLFDEYLRDV